MSLVAEEDDAGVLEGVVAAGFCGVDVVLVGVAVVAAVVSFFDSGVVVVGAVASLGVSTVVASVAAAGSVVEVGPAASASFLIPSCTAGSSNKVGSSAPSEIAAAADPETPGAVPAA